MWKECNIHLLPSNEASSSMVIEVCKKQLSDLNIGQLAYTPRLMPSKEYFDIINLYVTDDSEIREGDWIIWNSKVVQAINTKYHKTTKKIIATTDTSLNLSQIPKQFIEYYISEYNAGRKIEKVDVEEVEYMTEGWIPTYNNPDNHNLDKEAELDYRLKLSPTNEISIKPVEDAKELLKQRDDIENQINSIDPTALINYELTKLVLKSEEKMYSREEVISKLEDFGFSLEQDRCDFRLFDKEYFDSWIKENLK